jgi:aryl-alcohol dehydrogenase-like predicted oxidoreductase
MKNRLFGNSGIEVSEIGLGCWQLGGTDWGAVDESVALGILHAVADSGVTFFDTADVYGGGQSERLVGRFLKERQGSFFVATKLGRGGEMYPDGYTRASVRAAVDASLGRLGVEAIDLMQLHCVPTAVLREGSVFGWLEELKNDGKIRLSGASVESMEEAEICLGHGAASLQIIFNIFRQKPAEEILGMAAAQGAGIIVRLPFASGLLSGAVTAGRTFSENDHRSYNRNGESFNVGETFAGLSMDKGVDLMEDVKALVPPGLALPGFALRWILDHPAVSTVIPGATKVEQVAGNAGASSLDPLPLDVHTRLREFYSTKVLPHLRGPN